MRPGNLSLIGNITLPANSVISVTNGNGILASGGAYVIVGGFTITASGTNQALFQTMGYGVNADSASYIILNNCIIGSCGTAQIVQGNGGIMTTGNGGSITLTGTTQYALLAQGAGGQVWTVGATFNVSGLACSNAFACATAGGILSAAGMTFVGAGTVTGPKYLAQDGGVISINGGGVNYFPGSLPGNSATGYYG
jgi:hypothetical protein